MKSLNGAKIDRRWLKLAMVSAGLLIGQTFGQTAFAFEAIVSGTPGGSVLDIEQVIKSPLVTNARYVFSPDEQRMLSQAGRPALAASRKFTLKSEQDYLALSEQTGRRKIRVKIEPAEIRFMLSRSNGLAPMSSSGNPANGRSAVSAKFDDLLWGMKNIGQKVSIALDDLTSYVVAGKKGEDIGLDRSQKESSDPAKKITIAVLDTGVDFGHPEMLDQLAENVPECRALAEHTKCLKDAAALQSATPGATPGATVTQIAEAKKICDGKYLGKDFDGNGYPLDCSGWNLTAKSLPGSSVWGDNDARDNIGHGTHIAGILSARKNDQDGVYGVIQNSRILPVKVITASPTEPIRPAEVGVISANTEVAAPSVSTSLPSPDEGQLKAEKGLGDLVARGILYSLRSGAQIINMSLGWPADVDSNLMSQMIDLARSRGVLIVAAAGNDGTDALIRPCIFEGVICVASHDPDGAISHFSNHGAGVDIAAPGLGILSLFPTTKSSWVFTDRVGYEQKSGTSMAAPYVAGILARLLNAGYSAQEAHARLLLGTRTVAANPRVNRNREMIVQTGNADLEKALSVKAQPLILATTKRPLLVKWDRIQKQVKLQLEMINLWSEAKSVSISLEIEGESAKDVTFTQKTISTASWKSGEKKAFPVELQILNDRLDSELLAKLQIESVDAKSGVKKSENRYVALEIVSVPSSGDREIENRSYSGDSSLIVALGRSLLRTVQSLDGGLSQDYMAIENQGANTRLILLKEVGNQFRVSSSATLPAPKGTLLVLHRVDLDGDGKSDYALVWKQPPNAGTRFPLFNFHFFDESMKPLALVFDGKKATDATYGNSISVITDKFQWLKVGNRKVPSWISRGSTPESEKPTFDPWNPTPLDLPNFRLYYWGEAGLKTINKTDKTPVAFFPASREEMKSGKLKALWVSGDGTDQIYETSLIYDDKVHDLKQADLGGYRKIRPTMIAPIYDLSNDRRPGAGEVFAAGFFGESFRAAQRITAFSTSRGPIFDSVLTPLSKTDAIASVLAGFVSPQAGGSIFTQTIYELQYHEVSGAVVSTSLKKFSFMPGFFFQKLFFPAVGEETVSNRRLPMIYLAQGFGTGISMEVTAPRYESGRLIGLVRPAKLRLVAPEFCESMGDPLEASSQTPARVAFVCKDRVLFVPLKY
jgi:subtilisin family serine protease